MNIPYVRPEDTSRFQPGQIIRHFKRDFCTPLEKGMNKYLYKILALAKHTETGEEMLVYQAMYFPFDIYTRPLAMAEEHVDKIKYPDAKQEYRFEVYSFEKLEEDYGL